jgi:hypothetical protein
MPDEETLFFLAVASFLTPFTLVWTIRGWLGGVADPLLNYWYTVYRRDEQPRWFWFWTGWNVFFSIACVAAAIGLWGSVLGFWR